jgi:hypothetical protein
MNKNERGKLESISPEELAQIGNGALSYIKEVEGRDVIKMVGSAAQVAPNDKLFCLFNANGSPISISGTREGAVSSADEHELIAVTLH